MAASPLFTETISKSPSAKVCVTRRRIVGLSSARRIVRLIFFEKPEAKKPEARSRIDPLLTSGFWLLASNSSDSAELLCRRLARLYYLWIDGERTAAAVLVVRRFRTLFLR